MKCFQSARSISRYSCGFRWAIGCPKGTWADFARIVAVLDLSAIVSHWGRQDGCSKSACPRFFLVRLLVYV